MNEKIDWRSMFKSVLVRMREAGESNEMGARWMAAEADSAVYTALAAKDAEIARLREALEKIAGQSGQFGFPWPETHVDYPAFALLTARDALKDGPDAAL